MKPIITLLFSCLPFALFAQSLMSSDPGEAQFITTDIDNFWAAYDKMDIEKNPFSEYLDQGSVGLKDFIPYRIESDKNLLKTVKKRKDDYLAIRDKLDLSIVNQKILTYYKKLASLYPEAQFPTTYYVIGAFNSGGTASKNGIIIGVEVLQGQLATAEFMVAHESVHFNQNYPKSITLLGQCIREGAADFIAGLMIDSDLSDRYSFQYGSEHEEELCKDFTQIMNDKNYHGWLYGGKRKEGMPKDMGYWMGYKICEAYYQNAEDKKTAVKEILNIADYQSFLSKSGYLNSFMSQ
ncbi:gliding motility protein GldB-related protein [Fulvivirga ligni]|uniref:gliding motility protein GldB-related protein n=1 Tax=Fulvivirga ligni TaxID=2904246 RepID=UPI001F1DABE4|nr:DUF2268 domain-containing putative Zn-dependent protease [Fulvivirga ligni]UII24108.1 DUF2268 domain-containing protein [Fulvivirga ligni]